MRKQKGVRQQLNHIIEVLTNSLQESKQYSKPVFESEEASIDGFSKRFQLKLMGTKQVVIDLDFKKLFAQLRKKVEGLTKLFFKKDREVQSIKLKNRRLQRFFGLAKMEVRQIQLKIGTQKIKQILQNESKLNMSAQLFILKCFLSQSPQNQKYSCKEDALLLSQSDCRERVKVVFKIIHTYRPGQAERIISSCVPSLQYYRSSYLSLVNSEDLKNIDRQSTQGRDEEQLHRKCGAYLRYSMRIDFFNSVVKQQEISKYIQMFSIIQNRDICQGLIAGALWGIPKLEEPDFSDSDEEQSWEDKKQSLLAQFCSIFQGYYESQDNSKELAELMTRISLHQRCNGKDLFDIMDQYWLKE